MAANLSTIKARVEGLVIDVTAEAAARVEPAVRHAQREIEGDHGFLAMEDEFEFATVEDQRTHASYAKPDRFLRPRSDARPVRVDGKGATQEIDWLIAYGDRAAHYSDDPLDKGAPAHLYERDADFEVFPYPDALAPGGTLFADGHWRIRVPYFRRQPVLQTVAPQNFTNWFTREAEEYLVYRAAAIVDAFNRDWEEAALVQVTAQQQHDRLIREDKRARLAKQRLLRPVRGARGSAFQRRGLR